MIEYTVKVYANGDRAWFLNDQLHRVDGPAVEHADGFKAWFLNGKRLTEAEVMQQAHPAYNGKTATIDNTRREFHVVWFAFVRGNHRRHRLHSDDQGVDRKEES